MRAPTATGLISLALAGSALVAPVPATPTIIHRYLVRTIFDGAASTARITP